MTPYLERFWELLKSALSSELYTTAGKINFVFGILATGLVGTFLAGRSMEWIGNFFLHLFKRRGKERGERDSFWAIVSLMTYFLLSIIVIVLWGD